MTMAARELDYITIQGFKSIAHVIELELRPVNILIGPNGSGKSNFIEVFSLLHNIREKQWREFSKLAGGADQLLHFGSKQTQEIQVKLSFYNGEYLYTLKLKPTDDDSLYPSEQSQYGPTSSISASPSHEEIEKWMNSRFSAWQVYHVHDTTKSSPLRKTAKLHDNAFLRPDGSNLPAFLYLLIKKYPDAYSLIRRIIQRVAPFFDDFLLNPDPLNEESIRLAWRHKNSDQYFGASSLSDGTLRFIVLATLFLQPEELRPSVILVDEPELGLHPCAITLLASLVKQVSAKTQVILSTQSPQLLDHFEPEDVLVADRVNGSTQLTRLDSAKLAEWLEEYSLGQLWEKNEIGGRPAAE
jgi:predicted ATPase